MGSVPMFGRQKINLMIKNEQIIRKMIKFTLASIVLSLSIAAASGWISGNVAIQSDYVLARPNAKRGRYLLSRGI